jgi:sec-independent protein translocase protein TatB
MFDMSWGEVMVIGGVALIVIGPKDLPKALRTVGQMTTKVRKLAGEFQSQFNDAMREAELDEVRKDVEGLNRQVAAATSAAFNPIQSIRDELKGAVESQPASELSAVAPLPAIPAPAVDEAGPALPPAEIVPLPIDAGVIPPPADLTGPGLEQPAEPEPLGAPPLPKSASA